MYFNLVVLQQLQQWALENRGASTHPFSACIVFLGYKGSPNYQIANQFTYHINSSLGLAQQITG